MKIGFIGVGIMGKGMVHNLLKNNFEVHIFARNPQKVAETVAEGALFHPTIAECVQDCDAVITMVGFPSDVEEVYFGKNNIFDSAKKGIYLIDMTTTSPTLAERLSEEGEKRGFHVVDAPVTGGDTGAKDGTLSILVGGKKEDFEACIPVFSAMGNNINYQGAAGCGQHAKLANQIMVAGALSGVCEAFSYAKKKNLDLEVLFKSVSTGAAGSSQLNAFGPKIIAENYNPGFMVKHIVKDIRIAKQEAEKVGLNLEAMNQILEEYLVLESKGKGEMGTQTLIQYYME